MMRRVKLQQALDLIQEVARDLNVKSGPCAGDCPHTRYEDWSDYQAHQTLSGLVTKLNKLIPSDVAQKEMEEFPGNGVRVDFFRETGKWYTTETINVPGEAENTLEAIEETKRALFQHLLTPGKDDLRLKGMTAVVMDCDPIVPFPLMFPVSSLAKFKETP